MQSSVFLSAPCILALSLAFTGQAHGTVTITDTPRVATVQVTQTVSGPSPTRHGSPQDASSQASASSASGTLATSIKSSASVDGTTALSNAQPTSASSLSVSTGTIASRRLLSSAGTISASASIATSAADSTVAPSIISASILGKSLATFPSSLSIPTGSQIGTNIAGGSSMPSGGTRRTSTTNYISPTSASASAINSGFGFEILSSTSGASAPQPTGSTNPLAIEIFNHGNCLESTLASVPSLDDHEQVIFPINAPAQGSTALTNQVDPSTLNGFSSVQLSRPLLANERIQIQTTDGTGLCDQVLQIFDSNSQPSAVGTAVAASSTVPAQGTGPGQLKGPCLSTGPGAWNFKAMCVQYLNRS